MWIQAVKVLEEMNREIDVQTQAFNRGWREAFASENHPMFVSVVEEASNDPEVMG